MRINNEIRRKILEIAYERFQKHPYNHITPRELVEIIGVDLKTLHFNVACLEEKSYVELQKPVNGSVFVTARITSAGIDLVEDTGHLDVVTSKRKKRITRQDSQPPNSLNSSSPNPK